ncbi:DNA polymerase IV [Desulforamulus aeronauticus]|uniref:DNA polymerase IV n=1 Tax=Desulforamulus aeronauticus DSM 10349 TaxID=1121421 RepID=A0A1M6SQ56_9FIRM|nr:DNA polymerase IV [Desulforamulus aeronauticus]SHK46786.1 DNA polymerase-4 [Desulforamulus aeronauticus DSM 10349]
MTKVILLCDINSFFASVHQALDPGLQGKPVVVGGDPAKRTGIVLAASVEAKKRFGIKTGMTVAEAKARSREVIFVSPSFKEYVKFSTSINKILKDFSDLVEPCSIDESFVDITGCLKILGSPLEIAGKIQGRINNEIGVGVNIGIGPSKLVAKMAAELEKPNKIIPLTLEDWPHKIWPLPVKELFGVGSRIGRWLNQVGVKTIGDLAVLPPDVLKKRYGLIGEVLHHSAQGIDFSPVDPQAMDVVKSVGNQITLPRDYLGFDRIKVVILELAEEVAQRARRAGCLGNRVSLTMKDPNFFTETHSRTLYSYTDITQEIYDEAVFLLQKHWHEEVRVRLVGLTLSGLLRKEETQLNLLVERDKQERIDRATDLIRSRWGQHSIKRAVSLTDCGVYHER